MVFKGLVTGLAKLCLAGACMAGCANQASAQEFAPENGNMLQLGFRNDNQAWNCASKIKFNNLGTYAQVGRGLSNNLTVYLEGAVENVVLNNGLEDPCSQGDYADVSPNHFIPGIGIGARMKFYEDEESGITVCGDVKASAVSGFEEYGFWSPVRRSELYVHGITSLDAQLWVGKKFCINDKEINIRLGVALDSDYATGDVVNYTTLSQREEVGEFHEFKEINKANVRGILGFDYRINPVWKLNTTLGIGSGTGVDVGFSRTW